MSALGTKLDAQAAGTGAAGPAALMTRDKFLPLVSSSFEVKAGEYGRTWMTLLSVESMGESRSSSLRSANPSHRGQAAPQRLETTLLNFQSTDASLSQGTYEFSSSQAGNFQLFVVPAGNSLYTATLCHLVGA